MAKRAKESSRTGRPAMIMITPITRNPEKPNNAGAKCQRVTRHGTYTASVPGAMTRKMADPIMAAGRSIKSQGTGNREQVTGCRERSKAKPTTEVQKMEEKSRTNEHLKSIPPQSTQRPQSEN